jgi:predicted secreted protein
MAKCRLFFVLSGVVTASLAVETSLIAMKLTGIEVNKRLASSLICIVLLLGSLLPFTNAIAAPPPEEPDQGEVKLGAEDDGRQVELKEGQVLVVSLEGNPSTGYTWELAGADEKVLRQKGEVEFEPESPLLGAPGKQIMRFEALGEGRADLDLVYRRPWEKGAKPARTFSLQVKGVGPFSRARSPSPTPTAEPTVESPASGERAASGLPTAFNWCDQGGCTPVKNQGSCGSCWAFGTVGPLESNILIHDGVSRDLAEQYLLSCNTEGWGCNGGWWAHDYHSNKVPSGEPGAGAVYEADFPYQAYTAPCNPPHTHHEKIVSWAYVGGSSDVPSTSDIKQAIYDHGPVATAVCIGPAFQSYGGGVFQTNECTTVNHAIVLVGWDDSQGAWYLRNSWGPGWGESGYMRIKYGTSSVGYGASYVVYGGGSPDLGYNGHSVDDGASGNNDGVVNCGETIELYVTLHNQGSEAATGVNATISTGDPYVTSLYNTSSSYPDIAVNGTGTNSDGFGFALDPNTPNGHALRFNLNISASNGGPWSDSFDVPVVCGSATAPWSDDMEKGINGWTYDGLWHQVQDGVSPYPNSHTPTHSWWYGQDSTGNYDTGAANSGSLTTPPVIIPSSAPSPGLGFWYWYQTETTGTSWDQRWIQISVNGGAFQNLEQLSGDAMQTWHQRTIGLSAHKGQTVQIRFYFNTIDDMNNTYRGWYVDDVQVSAGDVPAAPSKLVATPVSQTQINLSWADNSNDESGFKVERSPNGTSDWMDIATVGANVTAYANTGLACNTRYYYRVRAYNAGGYSSYSNTYIAITFACTPVAPGNLVATPASQAQINLSWADNSNDESGFKVERSPNGTSDWMDIATVGANVTAYANAGLSCGTTYYYRVRAYNAGGDSDYSNTDEATTSACSQAGVSNIYLPLISSDDSGNKYAVVVGVADYQYISDLDYTDDDAIDFYNLLINKGGFRAENIRLLLSSQASKASIQDAITNWLDSREDSNSLVVFFFSGHGGYTSDQSPYDESDYYDEYICPYDMFYDSPTAILDDELDTWLSTLESQRIAVFIDTCFSGGMIQSMEGGGRARGIGGPLSSQGVTIAEGDGFVQDINKAGRVVLTASSDTQYSWEFGALQNGAFTYYLVAGLNSSANDGDGNGQVAAEEVYPYLQSTVDSYVYSQTYYHQNPQKYDGVAGDVDITSP